MRNGSTYEYNDAGLKDKLIADLKKELYQLKELDHEYLKLLDEVKSAQSRYSLLQDDCQRIQNEYKIKADINRTNISQLKNELDSLKMQIYKYNVSIDQIIREINNFNRASQNRENQISTQMGINQDLQKNNEEQAEANKILNQRIQSMKEERNKCESECERLRKLLDESTNVLKQNEKDARHIESSNHRHESILQIALADRDDLIQGLNSREQLVENTKKKLDELQKQRQQLKDKTNRLQKECIKSESDLKQVSTDLDNGINRNKELANKLKNQQKILRNAEGELDKSLLQKQALIKEYNALAVDHASLDGDVERCLRNIIQLEKYNEDLQRQIKFFIENDEEARKMLNRRQAMTKMLEQVQNILHKTSEEIAHLR